MGKEEKKYSLQKNVKKAIAIGLSIITMASAGTIAAVKQSQKNKEDYLTEDYLTEDYEDGTYEDYDFDYDYEAFFVDPAQDSPKSVDYKNNKIYANDNGFDSYLDSLKFKYEYEDIYGVDEAYKLYLKSKSKEKNVTTHTKDVRSDGINLTADDLYDSVIKNNKIEKDTPYGLDSFAFSKLRKRTIRKACEIIVDEINREYEQNPDLDMDELCCVLGDLQMFYDKGSFTNAYVDQYNRMIINEDNIDDYGDLINNDFEQEKKIDAFEQVIRHEARHLIQAVCPDYYVEGEYVKGNSYQYDDLKNNPMFYSWLLEASAEYKACKSMDIAPTTYNTRISYYKSLMTIGMINPEYDALDMEDITFNKHSEAIFDIMGAKTDEEKKAVIKMMFNVEIMQTENYDFFDRYLEKYGVDLNLDEKEKDALFYKLRIEILKQLDLVFYKNLEERSKNGSLTLSDVMYLINMQEADIYSHLLYNEKDRIETSVEYFDWHNDLQNHYFETISKSSGYSASELSEILSNYSMFTYDQDGNVINNYTLNGFSDYEKEFLQEYQESIYKTGIPTLQYMEEYAKENGYAK